jgi:hypothetical protein
MKEQVGNHRLTPSDICAKYNAITLRWHLTEPGLLHGRCMQLQKALTSEGPTRRRSFADQWVEGVLRRVAADGDGDLPAVPGQGGGAAAVGGGRALEPAVRGAGAGRLARGLAEQRGVAALAVADPKKGGQLQRPGSRRRLA